MTGEITPSASNACVAALCVSPICSADASNPSGSPEAKNGDKKHTTNAITNIPINTCLSYI
jgi:hypothetical protein